MKSCFVGGVQPPQKGKERTVFPVACFLGAVVDVKLQGG